MRPPIKLLLSVSSHPLCATSASHTYVCLLLKVAFSLPGCRFLKQGCYSSLNPLSPPVQCLLIRIYLQCKKIWSERGYHHSRLLFWDVSCHNHWQKTLAVTEIREGTQSEKRIPRQRVCCPNNKFMARLSEAWRNSKGFAALWGVLFCRWYCSQAGRTLCLSTIWHFMAKFRMLKPHLQEIVISCSLQRIQTDSAADNGMLD